tara:strand:- start:4184 stop:4453 length:270 start_codon:yes stop_codon:yes gene_type:complete
VAAETETQKPYLTIDDVQINIDDLPEEAQGIFARVQRLTQKRANLALDLEEIQAGINFFTNRIVNIYNEENSDANNKEVKSKTSDKKDT